MKDTNDNLSNLVTDAAVRDLCYLLRQHKAFDEKSGFSSELIRPSMPTKYKKTSSGQDGFVAKLLDKAKIDGFVDFVKQNKGPNFKVYLLQKNNIDSCQEKDNNKESRSREFMSLLKSNNMGPFFGVRDKIFDVMIEETIKNKDLSPSKLVSIAITYVKKEAEKNELGVKKSFPWRFLRIFIEKIMRDNNLFLDSQGESYNFSLDNDANKKVSGIVEDWEGIIDESFVLFLIKNKKDVTTNDYIDIAGAVYGNRGIEYEERVRNAVIRLNTNNKIRENEQTLFLELTEA